MRNKPFTFASALIVHDVEKQDLPAPLNCMRHLVIVLAFVAFIFGFYELMRYCLEFGSLPSDKNYVLLWAILILAGGVISTIGALTLHRGVILSAALVFLCLMGPATPNMIVMSQGEEFVYFIYLTIFYFVAGFV